MKSLGLLGLVFDTGLSVTPFMGHLGCLASHWSVPGITVLHRAQLHYEMYMKCVHLGTHRSQLLGPCAVLSHLHWSLDWLVINKPRLGRGFGACGPGQLVGLVLAGMICLV